MQWFHASILALNVGSPLDNGVHTSLLVMLKMCSVVLCRRR